MAAIGCFVVGLFFLIAGFGKAFQPEAFFEEILRYRFLGPMAASWVAVYLPWLEIATGFSLFLRRYRPGGALVGSLLLFGFSILLAVSMVRGLNITCGCLGAARWDMSLGQALVRNIILFLALLPGLFQSFGRHGSA